MAVVGAFALPDLAPQLDGIVKALILYIIGAIQTRRDAELGQALQRMVTVPLIALYLVSMLLSGIDPMAPVGVVLALIAAEFVVATMILGAVLRRPGLSYSRRAFTIATDYVMLGTTMFFMDRAGAPLYIAILWVTIGHGLRYGRPFLHAAIAAAFATMTLVVLSTPFWQASPALAWGLVVGTVAIPLYLSSLIRDLNATIEEAKRANRSKSQFLADMSQEFRTPLNGIVGMAELLATSSLSPAQLESAEVIQTSARSLQLLVDDVLDVSALESGALKRSEEDFRVSEIVKSVQVMLMPIAMSKGVGFKVAVQPHVPNRLHGDAPHLRQILLNLGARAIRTASDGRVSMNVKLLGDAGSGSVLLRFAMRQLPARGGVVWDPRLVGAAAVDAEIPAERIFDGGLVSTIVRTLTDLLGGTMGAETAPEGSLHVWIDLPLALADQDAGALPVLDASPNVVPFDDPCLRHRARVRTLRIVVADDQAASRLVVQRIVERAGHVVTPACDGQAALELLKSDDYDVAIVDMHLPRCNALGLLRELNSTWRDDGPFPVIVLSADATAGAIRAALDAGAHACLSKPISIGRLLEELADVAGRSASTASTAGEQAAPIDNRVIADLSALRLGATFVIEFVEQCIADAEENVHALESAIIRQRWSAMNEAADALRGVCVNLGARVLAGRCAELMKLSPDVIQREWRARIESIRSQLESVKASARAEAKRLRDKPADGSASDAPPL